MGNRGITSNKSSGGGGGSGNQRAIQPITTDGVTGVYALHDAATGDPITGSAYQVTVGNIPSFFTGTTTITLTDGTDPYIPQTGLIIKGTYTP